ncbi:MAG: ATPase [Parcubacteria group bacterium]|nr:MAG: ATPase [Parcubacteria group bacterium]
MVKSATVWHALSAHQSLKNLNSTTKGLTESEAEKRRSRYGLNILAKRRPFSVARLFLYQFKSPLVYILIIASIVSVFFSDLVDALLILAAVLINVIIGFIQEYKANRSLEQLNSVVKKETLVWRDGREKKTESSQLVPGDIINLQSGDRVPADARVIDSSGLETNEASLTGESWPIKKKTEPLSPGLVLAERANMVYMGTLVVVGRGTAVVTETGIRSEIGQITTMLAETADDPTPLQKKLSSFSKSITKVICLVSLVMFVFGMIKNYPMPEMFIISVAVAVSAIPEGLAISLTMILTVGMRRILHYNGLVRRLVSAETLGSTTVICTDKTGTLTEGEMRVTQLATASHHLDLAASSLKDQQWDQELNKISQISLLCNNAIVENSEEPQDLWKVIATPTEKALFLFGLRHLDWQDLDKKRARKNELPFDSQYKYMITRHHYDQTRDIEYLKGAPEKILGFCLYYQHRNDYVRLGPEKIKYFDEAWQEFSRQGLRVLAGAYRLVSKNKDFLAGELTESDFIFVGIWGLSDPLRLEIKETLQQTLAAGIRTVIITGDNKYTARTIAQSLGWELSPESVITGEELLKMDDARLARDIKNIKVYARVTPADKLRIINAWRQRGEVVSMTGDGVNDAPALKAADVGVAVMSGSDVAKETADLVLLDNNFSTIVMAVKQGRVVFANIKKVILFLLSDSFSQVIIVIASLLVGLPLPLLTAQILWVNIISDGLPALSLTLEPEEERIMNQKPKVSASLMDWESKFLILAISLITSISSLWIFWFFWSQSQDIVLARTVTFTTVALETMFYVFSVRALEVNILKSRPWRNWYLNISVIIGVLLQLVAIYHPFFNEVLRTTPLSWSEWLLIISVVISAMLLTELIKPLSLWLSAKFSQTTKPAKIIESKI